MSNFSSKSSDHDYRRNKAAKKSSQELLLEPISHRTASSGNHYSENYQPNQAQSTCAANNDDNYTFYHELSTDRYKRNNEPFSAPNPNSRSSHHMYQTAESESVLNRKVAAKFQSISTIDRLDPTTESRRGDQSISTELTRNDIEIRVDTNRDYVECKHSVDGRAIWRYIRETSKQISEEEQELLKFCIAELSKIRRPWVKSNMELRIFSDLLGGSNPVFYSGRRRRKFVAVWHKNKDPEFIEVSEDILSYLPSYLPKMLLIILCVAFLLVYLWFMGTQFHEFVLELGRTFNATININGRTDSDLSFDDLDININMNAKD